MKVSRIVSFTVAALVGWSSALLSAPADTQPANPFRSNVKVEFTKDLMIVHSDGIPDHQTGQFPNPRNPNTIQKQNYTFKIPLHPQWSDKITKTPMGPIGVAVNGVPFYNPYNAEGADAAKNEVFDECCGHPDQMGRYHYHIYPKCVKTPFKKDDGTKHSDLLGYAFDGYAIYGPLGEGGKKPTDLDECNGHSDAERGYHYHVTDQFPYIIGGYHGVVEQGNMDGPRERGRNAGGLRPPPGRRPPPGGPPPQN
jgi:hypothetical protein